MNDAHAPGYFFFTEAPRAPAGTADHPGMPFDLDSVQLAYRTRPAPPPANNLVMRDDRCNCERCPPTQLAGTSRAPDRQRVRTAIFSGAEKHEPDDAED